MNSSASRLPFILLALIILMQPGCVSVGTVILGSALGVAGQQGVGYLTSRKTAKIFYSGMDRSIYSVEKSFYHLSITMEKKEKYSEGTILFRGKTETPRISDVEVTLKPISTSVTEIVIVSRKGIFPDETVCHTLMEAIDDNINHARRDKFAKDT